VQKDNIVIALGALAQGVRLELASLLARSGTDGLPAGVIAARLGIAPALLSFHLQQLVRAGLINRRRRSRFVIYAANQQRMTALLTYLSQQMQHHLPQDTANENDLPPAPGQYSMVF
jgi:DNA-binding transcriptional ArsR family regulator